MFIFKNRQFLSSWAYVSAFNYLIRRFVNAEVPIYFSIRTWIGVIPIDQFYTEYNDIITYSD